MGQVWRATDTTLGRQVAIKILPDAFAADPERLARLEREAKTLASRVGARDGQRFLMIKETAGTAQAPTVVVVLNWLEELQAKLPVPR